MVATERSEGVNPSEKILGQLCDRVFLKAWTYRNPYRAKGKELCDLLVVFDDHIFIFEVKEIKFNTDVDVHTAWKRWKNKAITKQLQSLKRAKNWILNHSDRIYLDAACKDPFPINISDGSYKIHKILVAHGTAEACKNYFGEDIVRSLTIHYGSDNNYPSLPIPFRLILEKHDPVHVLDDHSLAIVLGELDTAFDFTEYLIAKERTIQNNSGLAYRGEEDLLAYYFFNFEEFTNERYIGADKENISALVIEEGAWNEILKHPDYKRKKAADKISYGWDILLQGLCELAIEGSAEGSDDVIKGHSAIYEMAKEPRVTRRFLAEDLRNSLLKQKSSQKNSTGPKRFLSLRGSYYETTAYVFLLMDCPSEMSEAAFLQGRRHLLQIACGAAKNFQPQFTKIVGIAYGFAKRGVIAPEDFMLLNCKIWTEKNKSDYEEANKIQKFFVETCSEFPG